MRRPGAARRSAMTSLLVAVGAATGGLMLVQMLEAAPATLPSPTAPASSTPGPAPGASASAGGALATSPPTEGAATDYRVVDQDVIDAVASESAPAGGVSVVVLAEESALADPAFRDAVAHLTPAGDGLYRGEVTATDVEALGAVDGLKVSLDRVISVEPTVVLPAGSAIEDIDDSIVAVPQVDPALESAQASTGLDGTGEVIAIIDTGIDTNALGLAGKVVYRRDLSTPTGSCTDRGYLDPDGHGTHVASIAAGAPVPGTPGVHGVAPGAQLIDLRVFNCAGQTSSGEVDAQLQWVLANHAAWGISVVSMSLGGESGVQDGTDTTSILVNRLVAAGVVVTIAAGNLGDAAQTVFSPGTAKFATTVGAAAVTPHGASLAPFSSQGPVAGGPGVDFLAAGVFIEAANSTGSGRPGATAVFSGTSSATPYVAGLAAILLQKDPTREPSGTTCSVGPSCPIGVVEVTMANGIEDDISASDWFATGPDTLSGHGLVSASRSILGVASPAALHAEGQLRADSPTFIEVPAHAQPVTVTIVLDAGIEPTGGAADALTYSWLDATGATWPAQIPCGFAEPTYVECAGAAGWTPRVWSISAPPSSEPSYLRLLTPLNVDAQITVPGVAGAPPMNTGIAVDDVVLSGAGSATVTVERTVPSGGSTVLTIVPSDGIDAPASVTLSAGAAGTTASFVVTEDAGHVPTNPQSSARVALQSGGALVAVASVQFAVTDAIAGYLTVGGLPITQGDFLATSIGVTTSGTVVGTSNQPALARAPEGASGPYSGVFAVAPGSNDAVPVAIDQTDVSSLDLYSVSADGNILILDEAPLGSGIVLEDDDTRDVVFRYDRTTHAATEVGAANKRAITGIDGRPRLSEDGANVAYMSTGTGFANDLYFQGGSGVSAPQLVASFTAGTAVRVRGVTATTVLVEVRVPGSSLWSGRLYTVSTGTPVLFGAVTSGGSSMSPDGQSIGYVGSNQLTVSCYRVGTGTTTSTFNVAGRYATGSRVAVGNSCAYVVGTFERVPAYPPGWGGTELVKMFPGGSRTVLASSSRLEDFWWLFDTAGNNVLTYTGAQLSAGDTNGLVDLYRGAYGVDTAVTAGTPTITGYPAVGSPLSANPGTWAPDGVDFTYEWRRAGSTIQGATDATYTPVSADFGATLTVTVMGGKFGYLPTLATSAPTGVVLPSGAYLPRVDAVSPGFGPTAGGTAVTLSGVRFTGATEVTFDGVDGTSLSVVSDTELMVTTPPGADPQARILVTVPAGASLPTPGAFFAYTDSHVMAGTPTRIVDSPGFTAGVVRCYPVVGLAGVPDGAAGVVLNVTTAGPSAGGYVVVYPDYNGNGASPAPLSSTVNFEPARDVANAAWVALPSNGDVCVYSQGGRLGRLILDVAGYTVPGSGITLQNSARLLDTRAASHVGEVTGPVLPGTPYTVQVSGNAGVPPGATAVVVNVTVTNLSTGGHLRMWEAGISVPNTSVVNYAPGQTKANGQIIALSPDGELSFESFGSSVQVIIDITGYVTAPSDFVATAPTRIVETRAAYGAVGITSALVPNTPYAVALDAGLVPLTATAVVMNVTAVNPTAGGNLRVYPDTNGLGTTPPPLASNLNYIPFRAIPNMVIVHIPSGRMIDFYNNQGSGASRTDLIVDVIGYIDSAPL